MMMSFVRPLANQGPPVPETPKQPSFKSAGAAIAAILFVVAGSSAAYVRKDQNDLKQRRLAYASSRLY